MNWWPHIPPLQLAFRAAVASAAAVAVAELMHLAHPLYAMIATVIVTDLSPKQTRSLGISRMAGTLIGATVGAALSSLFRPGVWLIGLGILLAMFLSHLLHHENAARLSGYVCGIVVLNFGGDPWVYALYRTLETVIGIVMAVLVSLVPKLIKVEKHQQDS